MKRDPADLSVMSTPIPGLWVIKRTPFADKRGFLDRLFCQEKLTRLCTRMVIRQVNRTLTVEAGTVRGLHFQHPPHAEKKLVCCLRGKVWDVAVDLRKGSATFLQYYATTLTEENRKSLLITEGFAHGFQTLTTDCEMLYLHTADYNPAAEDGINALDARVGIPWPQRISAQSDRDINFPLLDDNYTGLSVL